MSRIGYSQFGNPTPPRGKGFNPNLSHGWGRPGFHPGGAQDPRPGIAQSILEGKTQWPPRRSGFRIKDPGGQPGGAQGPRPFSPPLIGSYGFGGSPSGNTYAGRGPMERGPGSFVSGGPSAPWNTKPALTGLHPMIHFAGGKYTPEQMARAQEQFRKMAYDKWRETGRDPHGVFSEEGMWKSENPMPHPSDREGYREWLGAYQDRMHGDTRARLAEREAEAARVSDSERRRNRADRQRSVGWSNRGYSGARRYR